jgi:hypothetical protein
MISQPVQPGLPRPFLQRGCAWHFLRQRSRATEDAPSMLSSLMTPEFWSPPFDLTQKPFSRGHVAAPFLVIHVLTPRMLGTRQSAGLHEPL